MKTRFHASKTLSKNRHNPLVPSARKRTSNKRNIRKKASRSFFSQASMIASQIVRTTLKVASLISRTVKPAIILSQLASLTNPTVTAEYIAWFMGMPVPPMIYAVDFTCHFETSLTLKQLDPIESFVAGYAERHRSGVLLGSLYASANSLGS